MISRYKIKERLIQKSQSPFVRSLGVYTLLNFFLKGISFLITPLFTNYINPAEFGNLNLYLNSINLISPLIILSTYSITVDYFKVEKKELGKQISTYFLFSFYICLGIAIFLVVFHNYLTAYFKFPFIYILAVPFICFFNLIIDTGFVFFRNENMLKKITVLTIFRTILEICLSVFFIMYLLKGAEGRILSMLIATTIAFMISFMFVYRMSELRFKFNFEYIRKEYKFWLSTIVGFMLMITFQIADKYIIKHYCSPDELGQYSLASQFGLIISVISIAINSAYYPLLFKELTDKVSINIILKKIYQLVIVIIFVCIGSIFAVFIAYKYLINSQFKDSWSYFYFVSINYGLLAIINLFYGIILYFKLNKVLAQVGIFSFFVFIPLQILFVNLFQFKGIFLAQFLCLFAILVFLIIYSKKQLNLN